MWLYTGGPPAPLAALPIHYYSPMLYSALLLVYAILAPVWGSSTSPIAVVAALLSATIPSPREKLAVSGVVWLPLYAAVYILGLVASLYSYMLVWRILGSWAHAPPAVRLILEYLTESRLFVISITALVAVTVLRVVAKLVAPLAYALSTPIAARRVASDFLAREASIVERLRAWHHRVFTLSLSMLVALPVAMIVNAIIAVIYSRLEAVAPPGTRDALAFVRGAISMLAFFSTTRIVSKSIVAWLSGKSIGYTRPLHAMLAALAAALASITVAPDLLYPLRAVACITGCDPGLTSLDTRVADLAREARRWLEESEQLLRFLAELLWS